MKRVDIKNKCKNIAGVSALLVMLVCCAVSQKPAMEPETQTVETQEYERSEVLSAGINRHIYEVMNETMESTSIESNDQDLVQLPYMDFIESPLNGLSGYAEEVEKTTESETVETQEPETPKTIFKDKECVLYAKTTLNVRKDPTTEAEVIKVLNIGQKIVSTRLAIITDGDETYKWRYIPEYDGWSSDKYLSSDEVLIPLGNYRCTFYDDCAKCCGKWAGMMICASGAKLRLGVIAADRSIPFGTKIYIEGLGTYTVEDRGGAIKGNHFDIYVEDCEDPANEYLNGYRQAYIIPEN